MDNTFLFIMTFVLGLAIGGSIGAVISYLVSKTKVAQLETQAQADIEKIDWIKNSQKALRETFQALASKCLLQNARDFSGRINQQLNSHAKHISILKSSMQSEITQLDEHIRELESKREGAYRALTENVTSLTKGHSDLQKATHELFHPQWHNPASVQSNSLPRR